MNKILIQKLKDYFTKREDVVMAFLFGSRTEKNRIHEYSDWDIAVYFKPKEYLELESREDYLNEDKIWSDLFDILETNGVKIWRWYFDDRIWCNGLDDINPYSRQIYEASLD